MVVVGYGKFSNREYDLGIEKDIVIPATIQKVKIDVQKKNEHTLQAHYTPSKGKTVRILFQQLDEHGTGIKMDHFFNIEVKQGKRSVPIKKSHDKMIWCGLSWAVGEVSADDIKEGRPLEISCTVIDGNSEHCLLEVYEVEYSAEKK